jgi:hypothetical protein
MWLTLLVASLVVAACLAWIAPVVDMVAPNLKAGVRAGTMDAQRPCGNCGVIEDVRELRTTASQQEGVPQTGGRTGVVMIILGALGGNFHVEPAKIYEVEVRMQDGSVRTFLSSAAPARKPGDRVKVFGGRIEQVS